MIDATENLSIGLVDTRYDKGLYVGNVPGRKHPCLYLRTGSDIQVLASFRSADAALEAVAFLDGISGHTIGDDRRG